MQTFLCGQRKETLFSLWRSHPEIKTSPFKSIRTPDYDELAPNKIIPTETSTYNSVFGCAKD